MTLLKKVLLTIAPALLLGALGFAAGSWWSKETKPAVVVLQERQHVEAEPSKQAVPQSTRTTLPALQFNDIFRQPDIFEQLHLTYEIASQSNLDQLLLFLGQSYDDPDPLFNQNVTSILLERVIAIDPLEALAFIHEHSSMNQNAFISHVLTSWIRHDADAAIDYFKSLPDQGLKLQIGARLLADPFLSAGHLSEVESALGNQAERIGEQARLNRLSPRDAFEDALLSTDGRRKSKMMRAITRWYQRDPDAVLGRLSELTNETEKRQLMQVVISMQARLDPEKALAMLDSYSPDDHRLQQQVLTAIARQNPQLALPRVEALIAETGNLDILGNLLSQWIRTDKEAALAYMANMPQQYEESVYQRISYSYVSQFPEEGMSWLLSLDEKYDSAVSSPAMQVLANMPAVAESWLERLGARPVLHRALLSSMARQRAEGDPQDALAWLQQYASSPSYASARQSVLNTWAHRDPRGLAGWIEDDVFDPDYQRLFQMASQRWMKADPVATLDWIASLPASTGKANALSGAIPQLSDPEEAIHLLEDLPIESIEAVTMQLANSWFRREPTEVERIITRLDLSEQQAVQLRNRSQ